MKKNVGGFDRITRLLIGLTLVGWGITTQNMWGLLAIIPLFTAAIGWCPLYLLFRVDTCSMGGETNN